MTKINLSERNDLSLSMQAEEYKESIRLELDCRQHTKPLNPNEAAKREMATELMQQGFTSEAICRILNISEDQMPDLQQ